tara:strand:- start:21 stop:239 length:219 start_codon:yes stop_codon:yes gene_type:complete
MVLEYGKCTDCKNAFDGKRLLRENDIVIIDSNNNVISVLEENKDLEGDVLYGPEEYNTYDEIKYCDTNWWYE